MNTHWTYLHNFGGHKSFECQGNCGAITHGFDKLGPIADIGERLTPGDPAPAGECPECGAFVYPIGTAGHYDEPDMYALEPNEHLARIEDFEMESDDE